MTYQMNTSNRPSCPDVASARKRHFTGICEDCDAWLMAQKNLATIDDWYRSGTIGQDAFEAYMHVWAKHSPSKSMPDWAKIPEDAVVRRIAAKLEYYKGLS